MYLSWGRAAEARGDFMQLRQQRARSDDRSKQLRESRRRRCTALEYHYWSTVQSPPFIVSFSLLLFARPSGCWCCILSDSHCTVPSLCFRVSFLSFALVPPSLSPSSNSLHSFTVRSAILFSTVLFLFLSRVAYIHFLFCSFCSFLLQ